MGKYKYNFQFLCWRVEHQIFVIKVLWHKGTLKPKTYRKTITFFIPKQTSFTVADD